MARFVLIALAAATSIAAVPAAGQNAAQVQETPAQAAEMNKKVCKVDRMIGSRVRSQRICMTKRDWSRLQSSTRTTIDRHTREGTSPVAGGN